MHKTLQELMEGVKGPKVCCAWADPGVCSCTGVGSGLWWDLLPLESALFGSALEFLSLGCRQALNCVCDLPFVWVRGKERQPQLPVFCMAFLA